MNKFIDLCNGRLSQCFAIFSTWSDTKFEWPKIEFFMMHDRWNLRDSSWFRRRILVSKLNLAYTCIINRNDVDCILPIVSHHHSNDEIETWNLEQQASAKSIIHLWKTRVHIHDLSRTMYLRRSNDLLTELQIALTNPTNLLREIDSWNTLRDAINYAIRISRQSWAIRLLIETWQFCADKIVNWARN